MPRVLDDRFNIITNNTIFVGPGTRIGPSDYENCNFKNEIIERSKHSKLSGKAENCIIKKLSEKSFLELKRFCSALNVICLRIIYKTLKINSYIQETEYENFLGIYSEQAKKLLDEFCIYELEDWDTIVFLYNNIDDILTGREACHYSYEPCSKETNCDNFEIFVAGHYGDI